MLERMLIVGMIEAKLAQELQRIGAATNMYILKSEQEKIERTVRRMGL